MVENGSSKESTYNRSNDQPVGWARAFLSGVIGASLLMAFIDAFYLMGLTPFSLELFLGSMIRGTAFGPHNWTVGLFVNWILGGVFGIFYAGFFEYGFRKSSARIGLLLGLGHTVIAAFILFPIFIAVHQQMETLLYPKFGFLGGELDLSVPPLLVVGHLLFGMCVGLFYGPVRGAREEANVREPGSSGEVGDIDLINEDDDSEDRTSLTI